MQAPSSDDPAKAGLDRGVIDDGVKPREINFGISDNLLILKKIIEGIWFHCRSKAQTQLTELSGNPKMQDLHPCRQMEKL